MVVSILLYGCTTWTLTKRIEKKLDGSNAWMLRAILNKSWRQHPTKQQLYTHLPSRKLSMLDEPDAGHSWRSKDEHISDIFQWTSSHGRAKAGRPARTYIQQLCADTGCSFEDLPEVRDDRDGWRERVRQIHAGSTTWWWYIRERERERCRERERERERERNSWESSSAVNSESMLS